MTQDEAIALLEAWEKHTPFTAQALKRLKASLIEITDGDLGPTACQTLEEERACYDMERLGQVLRDLVSPAFIMPSTALAIMLLAHEIAVEIAGAIDDEDGVDEWWLCERACALVHRLVEAHLRLALLYPGDEGYEAAGERIRAWKAAQREGGG